MYKKLLLTFMLSSIGISVLNALEITRYVSIGGTGDGLTPENPTANLGEMLSLSEKVDRLILYVAPGFYALNFKDYGEGIAFKNVYLDGTWKQEDYREKVRIQYPGIGFSNGYINNVSFSGAVTMDNGVLYNCDADKAIYAGFSYGNVEFINCTTKSFGAAFYGYGKSISLTLDNCTAKDGGYGLETKNVNYVTCHSCKFNDQSEGGINIDNCLSCQLFDCEIGFNQGDGAVRLTAFDNKASAYFVRCSFIANRVTYNHSNNIYVYPNVTFADCLFADNTEKDIDHQGFIRVVQPDFLFLNCSFINNTGGVEMEQYYPDRYQIINCLFWNNGKTVAYAGGRDVPMQACAMDHGTGVPELDREKGLIILNEANKGFEYNGLNVELQPNSPLVNAGVSRSLRDGDLHRHPRNVFGATDIGCTEFISSPGLWEADPSQEIIELGANQYQLCKVQVGATTYYSLNPTYSGKDGKYGMPSYFDDFLYLDTMPVKPKKHGDNYIERHTKNNDGSFEVAVYKNQSLGGFRLIAHEKYASPDKRPQVKINDGKVQFVKPVTKTATQARKTTPAQKTTTKKPVTKRTFKK